MKATFRFSWEDPTRSLLDTNTGTSRREEEQNWYP